MKVKLLRKCRESIVILNNYGFPPHPSDKKIMVVRFYGTKHMPFRNSRNGIYFSNKENLLAKRRYEILQLAYETSNKLWYKILEFKWKNILTIN